MKYEEHELSLREEVIRLISLQQEGGYWDFKREWHKKKSSLLIDIICMANNLHNRNAYIIIGVDEENGHKILDVKNDQNRKNTQKIVDFLKDKKFAGGIRPVIHVEQLSLYSGDIDVIVIENSHNTPFYLTEQYEGVRANHIYTRVMDTNTPIDKSADINNVEYLWRKRFYLDETPLEKFRCYLKNPDDWETIQDDDMGYFYKYAPEYTILCDKLSRSGYEYYFFSQMNTNPSWWMITLKYHQTAIEKFLGVALDGGRCFVVAPYRAYDLFNTGMSCFGFYIYDDLKSRLLKFYRKKESLDTYSYMQYMEVIITFQSKNEQIAFFDFLRNNTTHYYELCTKQGDEGLPYFPDIKGYNMDEFKKDYRGALVIKRILAEFRENQ